MTKLSTGESPLQPNEQPQPRRRNIYDCDGEYEFPTAQHWTAPQALQVKQTITEWRRRMRSRHELASLDEISLQDIGMSQSTAEYEASKPFWIP